MKKIILLLTFLPYIAMAQHAIEGTFSPAEDFTYAFLYKSNPTGAIYVDRAKVDENGHFKIELDSSDTSGIYKIVYGVPQSENNFDLIYSGKEDVELTFSLTDGLEFKESNENKLWASYTNSIEMINHAISNFYGQQSDDKAAFKDIFKTLDETQSGFELASKGTLASVFILANRPYIPTAYEDVSTYSKNLKDTYLKSVDFSNQLLQSSEFLTDRVMAYIFGMSADATEDFYKHQIDNLVNYIGADNAEIKMALLKAVWTNMTQIEESNVANYITDTYLLKLAIKANDLPLTKELNIYKNTSIGATALDFPITLDVKGKKTASSLHKLNLADNYLLIFWNSGCSHCLQQLPEIRKTMDQIDAKKIKVIAYATQGESEDWDKEILKYPNFIHVIDSGSPRRYMGNEYGVEMTPTYFILDKNKKIIAKPDTLEEVQTLLNDL
ncbi:MAG: thioredoxin-like domain-containing protein [Gelidibacter sp.]